MTTEHDKAGLASVEEVSDAALESAEDALFRRAVELAHPAYASNAGRIPGEISDADAMPVAFLRFVDAIADRRLQDKPQACGWCIRAAGDDELARANAKIFTLAEICEHIVTCPNNPLVEVLEDAQTMLDEVAAERDLCTARVDAHTERIAELLADVAAWRAIAEVGWEQRAELKRQLQHAAAREEFLLLDRAAADAAIETLTRQNARCGTVCEELMEQLDLANKNSNAYRDAHMAYQRWASKLAPEAVGDAEKREAIGATNAEVQRLTTRRDELLALVARISQEEPLPDEVQNALDQRGALLAEVGTLRAKVAATHREANMLIEGLYDVTADRDHLRAALDVEIDGRAEAILELHLAQNEAAVARRVLARLMEPERCAHSVTARGKNAPRRYGSWATEVCQACGAFRTHGHDVGRSQMSEWRPASEYAEATNAEED